MESSSAHGFYKIASSVTWKKKLLWTIILVGESITGAQSENFSGPLTIATFFVVKLELNF